MNVNLSAVASDPLPAYSSIDLAQACAKLALDKKAENVVILEVSELTSVADYYVICTALSVRQTQAIARHVEEEAKKEYTRPLGVEGMASGEWVLIDFGDVVFHVFDEEARGYYDLDGLWLDAPRKIVEADLKHPVSAEMSPV